MTDVPPSTPPARRVRPRVQELKPGDRVPANVGEGNPQGQPWRTVEAVEPTAHPSAWVSVGRTVSVAATFHVLRLDDGSTRYVNGFHRVEAEDSAGPGSLPENPRRPG